MSFEERRFTSSEESARPLIQAIEALKIDWPNCRSLEIGCGTGFLAAKISKDLNPKELLAVDISKANIEAANAKYGNLPRLHFHIANYFSSSLGKFDLIFADSVLHLMPGSDMDLARKMAADLNAGGLLVVTMATDSKANSVRFFFRKLFQKMNWAWLDRVILSIATKIYPEWQRDELLDRMDYLRIIPHRLAGKSFFATLADSGLGLQSRNALVGTSLFKPDHEILIFKRK